MKKVLWASRHALTNEQLDGLRRALSDSVLSISQVDKTFKAAEELAAEGIDADVLAVVLPVSLLAGIRALCPDKTIVIPRSKRELRDTADGRGEKQVVFVYDGWEVVDEVIYRSHTVM